VSVVSSLGAVVCDFRQKKTRKLPLRSCSAAGYVFLRRDETRLERGRNWLLLPLSPLAATRVYP
jgi:hypothetical protein